MKPPRILQLSTLLRGATQLTRRGKLIEATAAIQRVLRGGGAASTQPDAPMGRAVLVTPRLDAPASVSDVNVSDVSAHDPAAQVDAAMPQSGDAAWNDVVSPDPLPDDTLDASHATPAAPSRRTSNAAGVFSDGTFDTPSGTRRYKVFVPGGTHRGSMPLVVMLHGCKQDPDDFAAGTRMNTLAQHEGVIVLYPQQPPRSNAAKCWNWFNPGDQQRDAGEPALLAAMTRDIIDTHPVDASRVYVAGLSAGGAMAAILGREYPDVYAAVGVHSGLAPGAAHDVMSAFTAMQRGGNVPRATVAPGAPVIVFHGDQDNTVHPDNALQVLAPHVDASTREDKTGRAGREYTHSVFRARGRVTAEYWHVRGAGHAWSGGSETGSYADAAGPDASREMLRFFLQHRLTA